MRRVPCSSVDRRVHTMTVSGKFYSKQRCFRVAQLVRLLRPAAAVGVFVGLCRTAVRNGLTAVTGGATRRLRFCALTQETGARMHDDNTATTTCCAFACVRVCFACTVVIWGYTMTTTPGANLSTRARLECARLCTDCVFFKYTWREKEHTMRGSLADNDACDDIARDFCVLDDALRRRRDAGCVSGVGRRIYLRLR